MGYYVISCPEEKKFVDSRFLSHTIDKFLGKRNSHKN